MRENTTQMKSEEMLWGWSSKNPSYKNTFCCPDLKLEDIKLWDEDALYIPRMDGIKGHSSAPPSTHSDCNCKFYHSYCTAKKQRSAYRDAVVNRILKKSKEKTKTKDRLYKISCLNLILIGQDEENIYPHNKPVNELGKENCDCKQEKINKLRQYFPVFYND